MTRTAITGESSSSSHTPEKVDLRLHQEPANPDQGVMITLMIETSPVNHPFFSFVLLL